ncbi:hypothetical protein BYT27DRAFT_7148853 [Phlegmacium glaucopus]|nr:hypothetical protein BYT27DRAFT_7148853 [Phlegmacium glaucopus]
MKVYQGSHAKERCRAAAIFMIKQQVMHSNVLRLIAVPPRKSESSFLIFDGEYEGTVDLMLGHALNKKNLEQSLILGMRTVVGLSAGLDYLHDLNYPFASVGLDHFFLLNCRGKIIISFDPDELPVDQLTQSDQQIGLSNRAHWAMQIFHGLCQKTFDDACKEHYDNQIQRNFDDDLYDDSCENTLKELGNYTGSVHPDLAPPIAPAPSSPTSTKPSSVRLADKSSERSPRSTLPNGRRQELVWNPLTAETHTLYDISSQFQYFLNSHTLSSLNRRRGRYTARTSHRCPGYNRIEITLTTDIMRSAIVFHSSPNPHERCSICKEIVKDAEIFNCICGGNDDESRATIQCSTCSEWHHRTCMNFFDIGHHKFVCERCNPENGGAVQLDPPILTDSCVVRIVLSRHLFLPPWVLRL